MEKTTAASVSGSIEAFLDFIRETEQNRSIAVAEEKDANEATQDILHAIEFGEHQGNKPAQLVKKIQAVRLKRRDAKDAIDTTAPVCDWVRENHQIVKSLERLLGDVRKVERRQAGRSYYPRTDILDDDK